VLALGWPALATDKLPAAVKNDPCLQGCQEQMRKAARSCHDKACFRPLFKAFTDCSLQCAEARHQAHEREPMCKDPKGKTVPCADLHPKKPQQ
jgi:hypothetical protein